MGPRRISPDEVKDGASLNAADALGAGWFGR
jgi:hypothetical protein